MAVVAVIPPILSLIGWLLNAPALRSLVPGLPPMIPLTAVCLILLAAALGLSTDLTRNALRAALCRAGTVVLSSTVLSFGIVTLLGHLFKTPTGLNNLVLSRRVAMEPAVLAGGNMSVQTALAVSMLATALLMYHLFPRRRTFAFFQLLPTLTIGLALLAVLGYIHDITEFYGSSKLIGLSIPTALTLGLLSLGTLALRPDVGFVLRLRGAGPDSLFLRRFTIFSLIAPTLMTAMITGGEAAGFYPGGFSNALFVVFTILGLLGMGFFTADALRKLEKQRNAFERAQSKAALRESQEHLRDTRDRFEFALEATKMGAWDYDLLNERYYWTETMQRLMGYAPGTFPETREAALKNIHPEDLEWLLRAQEDALARSQDLDADFRTIWPDGSVHWVRSKGRAKYGPDGRPTRFSGMLMDVTSEKLYQETIEAALEAAESANRLKSSFLANMSHEIRTPLGAIMGFTDLLTDPALTPAERENYLQIIQRNGQTLSHLINDILDLSKVESGHLDIVQEEFSVRQLVDEVVTLLSVNALEKGISLTVSYDPATPKKVVSDSMRLRQILVNLIGNAIKFTAIGGVRVSVAPAEASLVFEIADTGVGIEESQKGKLFQPFTQADGSMTRKFGGTGLGLVLSRRLAEILGGDVELVESEPGFGSRFRVTIENQPQRASRSRSYSAMDKRGPASPTLRLEGRRLLLVEDLVDNQKLLSRFLTAEGAVVEIARNGQEGVLKATMADYDLVLMDIQMPILDGFSATSKLRERGFEKPVIALTAHAMSDVRRKCMDAGCDDYITKPVNREQLVRMISEHLEERRPAATPRASSDLSL